MTVTVGIFEREQEALNAIRALKDAGYPAKDVRVVVNNLEEAPLLRGGVEAPVEELYGLQAEKEHRESDDFPLAGIPLATGVANGSFAGNNAAAASGIGFLPGDFDLGEPDGAANALRDIGLPADAAKTCGRAVESGSYLVVADNGSGADAASFLREAGASDVIG